MCETWTDFCFKKLDLSETKYTFFRGIFFEGKGILNVTMNVYRGIIFLPNHRFSSGGGGGGDSTLVRMTSTCKILFGRAAADVADVIINVD